jgi:hypothetical protein
VKDNWAEPKAFELEDGSDPYRDAAEHKIDLKAPIDQVSKVLSDNLNLGRVIVTAVKFSDGRMEEIREEDPIPAKAEAIATVAKPVRGCPAPNFSFIEQRAGEVLQAFLTPEQAEDFTRLQSFVSQGVDTGHRYMLTSRTAPDRLSRYGGRQLFDLDEQRNFCVHYDDDVPAPEELLALHLFLSLPGHESYLRDLTDGHGIDLENLVIRARQ